MRTAARTCSAADAPRRTGPRVLVPGFTRGRVLPSGGAFAPLATVRVDAGGRLGWAAGGVAGRAACAGADPLEALGAELRAGAACLPGDAWVGFLSYDLGRRIEPRAQHARREGALPLAEFHRVESGDRSPMPGGGAPVRTGGLVSGCGRAGYVAAVERTLAYIRAGDIYQANIAHRLVGRFDGSGAGLFARLARAAAPRHGMYLESAPLDDGSRFAIASLSPELFLSFDASTRRLVTRPMKGTRPGAADPAELLESGKDRAELAMIVDLMRNDLGRVCEFGSVRVDAAREIERHASGAGEVLQATATVSGVAREGLGLAEILAATFPPGSVTGTPKIRAMQVIDELEPFVRGPYCGCVGMIGDDGSFELAVAIRTGVVVGQVNDESGEFEDAEFSYCVGAGIVADSDPEAEWEETLAKAGVLEPVFAPPDVG